MNASISISDWTAGRLSGTYNLYTYKEKTMTEQIIPALITGAVLAMMFPTTRNMGIIATSALAFPYPVPMMIVVLIAVSVFLYKKVFSK